jgi:hypothetical protein
MRSGNQNLGRDLIYNRIDQVLDRLEASLSIESITQSKLGNKLSSVYSQLLQINDTGNFPVNLPKSKKIIVQCTLSKIARFDQADKEQGCSIFCTATITAITAVRE